MNFKTTLAVMGAAAAVFTATPAAAVTTFNLTLPAVGNYGTVTLTQLDSDTVQVVADLSTGYNFVDTGAHEAFAFQVSAAIASYTVTNVSPTVGYVHLNGPATMSAFGTFRDGFSCPTTCQGGNNSASPNDLLSFNVNATGITEASFVKNPGDKGGYYFAADIYGPGANGGQPATFPVATGAIVPGIPEPQTYALMLAGLAAIGFMARRRRQG